MKLIFRLLLCLSAVAGAMLPAGCGIFSSGPEEYPADINIFKLQERMQRATDPDRKFADANTYVQKQMLEVKQTFGEPVQSIVEIKFKRPDMFKMTILRDNQQVNSVIFNGKQAWSINYAKKTVTPIEGLQFETFKFIFAMGHPGVSYTQIFKDVKLSQVRLNELEYYKMVCAPNISGLEPYTIYVGKNNFLPKMLETTEQINGENSKYTAIMDSYAMYEGVMIAKESTTILNGLKQNYKMIYYKLNAAIDDSEFIPPQLD
jgi:outer membrane lipoprotein-sorting protein